MEVLVIDWVKEEAKMAKIILHIMFMFVANNSIFKLIIQYFLVRSIVLKECYPMMNFEKKIHFALFKIFVKIQI